MDNEYLGSQEVAQILKISRNTVYELIKRGELKSVKVGKQVRILRRDVEAYLQGDEPEQDTHVLNAKPQIYQTGASDRFMSNAHSVDDNIRGNEFIVCGQDIALDILANHFNSQLEGTQLYRSYLTSYNGIFALYQGRVNMATAHLWDGETNEYNVSYVKKMMPGIPSLMIRIGSRQLGFYVKKGNPKGITGWQDLKRMDLTIVNRERGSGTRVLLDEKLRMMGMMGDYIEGYQHECRSHLAVASLIAHGEADFGIGSESGLMNANGVDFIPLQMEQFDMIMRLSDADKQPYKTVMEILSSESFKMDLQVLGYYDVSETGKIILG